VPELALFQWWRAHDGFRYEAGTLWVETDNHQVNANPTGDIVWKRPSLKVRS
jgi:hypothetical protein